MNGIHLISTGKQHLNELINRVKEIHRDVDYIHLRERDWKAKDYVKAIHKLVEAGVSRQKIILNDRVDIAMTEGLYGVQLPTHSLEPCIVKHYFPNLKIGCSVHSVDEAKKKEAGGADFLLYGHIFETNSKPNLVPRGLEKLQDVVSQVNIPVIAIGGVHPDNVKYVFRTGAKGIAVLSGILLAEDYKKASLLYRQTINKVR